MTTSAIMMSLAGEHPLVLGHASEDCSAAVVHAFCLLASPVLCHRACRLCSLLRTLIFPGPYIWGWLVNLCLKSQTTLFFALCSANSRKLLTRALCPGFKAWHAPADFAKCCCVPANLLSRSLHPCKVFLDPNLSRQHVYSTVQNHSAQRCIQPKAADFSIHRPPTILSLCHPSEDTISSSQGLCIADARTTTRHPVNSNTA